MNENVDAALLPQPSDEMKYRARQVNVKQYPDGKPLVRQYTSSLRRRDQQTDNPTKMEAFDSIGQEVFDWRGVTIEGNDGVEDIQTIEKEKGLPVVVISRKIGTSFSEALADAFAAQLPQEKDHGGKRVLTDEELQQIIHIGARAIPVTNENKKVLEEFNLRKYEVEADKVKNFGDCEIVEYFYDENGRPVRAIHSIDLSPYIATKNEDYLVVMEQKEEGFYYDSEGRLRLSATYELKNGELVPDYPTTIYQYEDVDDDQVRVIEYSYSSIDWKDLSDGVYPHSARVRVVNKRTWEETGYALYEHGDFREKEILTNYDRVKRYPDKMTFRRRPSEPNVRGKNVEAQPLELTCPSWLVGVDVASIASGADLHEVGTRGDQSRKMEVYYFDEFVDKVATLTEEEAVAMAGGVMTGNVSVNMLLVAKQLQEYLPRIIRMQYANRFCFASIFLQLIASQVDKGFYEPSDAAKVIKDVVKPIVIAADAPYRYKGFTENYRREHGNLSENEMLALWAIDNLDTFPNLIEDNRKLFKGLLD